MTSRTLIKGTLILTIASVFTRILGLGNRMLLSRLIGAEGLGLVQMMLPFYALAAVVANLGLPGAVVKSVSDRFAVRDYYGVEQVRRIALSFVVKSALIGALFLFYISFSPLISYFPDQRIIVPLRLMPIPLFFAAITSIFKGYFQGQKNMIPTAVSQVGEQIVRVTFGIIAALYLLPYGLEYAILGIMIGVALGELVSLIIVLLFYKYHRRKNKNTLPLSYPRFSWQVTRELSALAAPLVVIRLSGSLTYTIQSFLIPARLQYAGLTIGEATTLLGHLSGMALPLLFLPTVAIIPLTTTLVPSIASAASLGLKSRLRRLLAFSLWGTFLVGLLTGLTLYFFNEPLTKILYSTNCAAPLVAQLAPVAPLAFLQFTTVSILHGLGRPGLALIGDLVGMSMCLLIIYIFTASPLYGIQGAILGYNINFILTSLLGLVFIYKVTKE